MARHIGIISHNAAVQSFVEQQVRTGLDFLPGREFAGLLAKRFGFLVTVQIIAAFAAAGFSVTFEGLLQKLR